MGWRWGVVVVAVCCCNALVVDYSEVLPGGTLDWFVLGLFNGSSVALNVTATRSTFAGAGHVEALVFHEEDLAYVGVHTPYNTLLCCDREVRDAGACQTEQMGYTALSSAVLHMPEVFYELIWFEDRQLETSLSHTYQVTRDGLYYVIFVNCNESNAGQTRLSGRVVWRNRDGFLDGSDAWLVPCYLGLGAVASLCAMGWGLLMYVRQEGVVLIDYGVMVLHVAAALAAFTRAANVGSLDETGLVCVPCALLSVVCATLFALALRVFALLVAMGLTVLAPWWDLERRQKLILVVLTVAYLLAAGGQNVLIALSAGATSSSNQTVFLMLPVNMANTAFIIAIFVELVQSIQLARDDGEREKFRKFVSHLLFLFAVAGSAMFFYVLQLLVQWRDVSELTWKFDFVFGFVWDAAMYGCVLCFSYAWMPGEDTKALIYREQVPFNWRPERRQ